MPQVRGVKKMVLDSYLQVSAVVGKIADNADVFLGSHLYSGIDQSDKMFEAI